MLGEEKLDGDDNDSHDYETDNGDYAKEDDADDDVEDANLSSGGSHSGKRSLTGMTMTIMIMKVVMRMS